MISIDVNQSVESADRALALIAVLADTNNNDCETFLLCISGFMELYTKVSDMKVVAENTQEMQSFKKASTLFKSFADLP